MSERGQKRQPKSQPLSLSFKSDRPLTDDDVKNVMRHMLENQTVIDEGLRAAVGMLERESRVARETIKRLSTPPPPTSVETPQSDPKDKARKSP